MSHEVVLETERLFLRCWRAGDLPDLQGILFDKETMSQWPMPFDEATSAAWLQRAVDHVDAPLTGRLAVHLKSDGTLIGDAGLLWAEINDTLENDLGYIVHRDFWRQGFGLEASSGLLAYAHESLGCTRVIANMAEDNLSSVGIARRLGMTLEGRFSNPRNLGKTHLVFVSQSKTFGGNE